MKRRSIKELIIILATTIAAIGIMDTTCRGQSHEGSIIGQASDPVTDDTLFLLLFRIGQRSLIDEQVPFGSLEGLTRSFAAPPELVDGVPVTVALLNGVDGGSIFAADLAGPVTDVRLSLFGVVAASDVYSADYRVDFIPEPRSAVLVVIGLFALLIWKVVRS